MNKYIFLLFMLPFCLAYPQKSKTDVDDNLIFLYNASLSGSNGVSCEGFDLDFHVNTYKILRDAGITDKNCQAEKIHGKNLNGQVSWKYKCVFNVTKHQLKNKRIDLNIENVTGDCSVYLNKKFVKRINNSFVKYSLDVKKYLKKGKNKIELVFNPIDTSKTNVRMPDYLYRDNIQYGYFSPEIEAVYFSFGSEQTVIDYADVQTRDIIYDKDKGNTAKMVLNIYLPSLLKQEHKIYFMDTVFMLKPNDSGKYAFDFEIKNAILWYPAGKGGQHMYHADICMDNAANVLYKVKFGVRKAEFVTNKAGNDGDYVIRINSEDIKVKGMDYIMYKDCTNDILLASNANINLLRVSCKSAYGSDDFFDLCDKYGILVIQELPYSDGYKDKKDFKETFGGELRQNLCRTVSHPSFVMLSCGEGKTDEDNMQIVKDNIALYAGELPFVSYEEIKLGFDVADNFPSLMNPETYEKYCHFTDGDNEDIECKNSDFGAYESIIKQKTLEMFGQYKDCEQYILFSQLLQQEKIKEVIQKERLSNDGKAGLIINYYNEIRPVAGCGCIDVSGEPKPAYYTVQKMFEPITFLVDTSDVDSVKVYISNESDKDTVVAFRVAIMNQDDSVHYIDIKENFNVAAHSIVKVACTAYRDLKNFNVSKDYLLAEGYHGDEFISNYSFFCPPKQYISFEKYLEVIYGYYFEDAEK